MDFSLTEDQERYRDELVRFARAELNDDLIRRDADETFDRELWKKCAAVGIQGLPVPEDYGGEGADRSRSWSPWRPWATAAATTGSCSPSTLTSGRARCRW